MFGGLTINEGSLP